MDFHLCNDETNWFVIDQDPELPVLMAERFYVGVDVGTGSVRAALVTADGRVRCTAEEPISIWKPEPEHFVQSSTEIWQKCCAVVKVGGSSIWIRH